MPTINAFKIVVHDKKIFAIQTYIKLYQVKNIDTKQSNKKNHQNSISKRQDYNMK